MDHSNNENDMNLKKIFIILHDNTIITLLFAI